MAYGIIEQNDNVAYGITSAFCDTRDDIDNMPTTYASGSTCIVIEDSSVWMLDSNKVWQEI